MCFLSVCFVAVVVLGDKIFPDPDRVLNNNGMGESIKGNHIKQKNKKYTSSLHLTHVHT